ncbi:MAG: C4-dicarboxylate ABC transporter, partial [Alcanivorax sp.]|nr:C4-dicarboxylate ABC transporter [Alcanivorax sp.]
MEKSSLTVANRSVTEWLSSLPTLIILLLTIFLASGEVIHSQLLKIGENTWDDYFLLRGAGVVKQPTCNPDANIEVELQKAIKKKKEQMAADPLASVFGTDVDEDALRKSLVSSQQICREKWDRFNTIQKKVT